MSKLKYRTRNHKVNIILVVVIAIVLSMTAAILISSHQASKKRSTAQQQLDQTLTNEDIAIFIDGDLLAKGADTHCKWEDTGVMLHIPNFQYKCLPSASIWVGTNAKLKDAISKFYKTAKDDGWRSREDVKGWLDNTEEDIRTSYSFAKQLSYVDYSIEKATWTAGDSKKSIHFEGLGAPVVEAAQTGKYKYIYHVKLAPIRWGNTTWSNDYIY